MFFLEIDLMSSHSAPTTVEVIKYFIPNVSQQYPDGFLVCLKMHFTDSCQEIQFVNDMSFLVLVS